MSAVQLLVAKSYDTEMVMHTRTHTSVVIFASEFQKHMSNEALKN